ncbi:hypothetical protein QWJ26_24315 [Streptomyces sp. CSDS2]|uniref:hypothetical protein n=1 Tax=Streptomyces sp. CSDS2 TaxID=3055051 RepID=UPI0025B223F8|nr:hypothetical protein [Streptomyces sp. CSDS2]MDN3262873.1 hypothetical protein [Streptomyces sp. CSDS2]
MVKSHGKKQRAKKKAQRTGASYSSAAAGTTHTHTPLPDLSMLPLVPHGSWRVLDLDLAARLVAACRAKCQPCQQTLITKMVTEQRATLAALAGAVYGTLPAVGFGASATTWQWAPLARTAMRSGAGDEAFTAVEAMDATAATALLNDALDHWVLAAVGSAEEPASPGTADRRGASRQADPMDAVRAAGVEVFTLDDLDLPDDIDTYYLAPNYGVMLMKANTSDGRPMPMLVLYPETEDAGIEDLERRTNWEHWGLHGMPDTDPQWRVRARIADRSLQGLVRVGPDGKDNHELWRAAETVSLSEQWWNLLAHTQHVLIAGPVKMPEAPGVMEAAGDAGELLAVVARVEFV